MTLTADGREAVLARGDALWERLRAALDARPHEPVGPNTDWTGHDVYAHFARWQQDTIDNLGRLLTGQPLQQQPGTEDAINERWRREDASLPTDEVRERCLRTRAELRDRLTALSDEQWRAFGRKFAPDIDGEHYEHHLAMCEEGAAS